MKLLLFEWLNGGGLWCDGPVPAPAGSLEQQGFLMLQSLADDLTRGNIHVTVPIDSRLRPLPLPRLKTVSVDSPAVLQNCLLDQASACDAVILIAPECDGCLSRCCQWLKPFREKLLSPDWEFIVLTSDKQASSDWLTARGVRVPAGYRLSDFDPATPREITLPAVIKPVQGAGSEHIQKINHWNECPSPKDPEKFRLEAFVPGDSVSVSVLCGKTNQLLPPTGQIFDASPIGNYVETKYPLEQRLSERATRLAGKTIAALPPTRGYVGIDMILSSNGSEFDCVVDINPRLTMSYPKLSQICDFNLGIKMIEIAQTGTLHR